MKWEAVFHWIFTTYNKKVVEDHRGIYYFLIHKVENTAPAILPYLMCNLYEGVMTEGDSTKCESMNVFHEFLMFIGSTSAFSSVTTIY